MKKQWYYEVRTEGDGGEYAYFSWPSSSQDGLEFNYSPRNLRSARHYAKYKGGYVVRVTVEPV